MVADNVAAPLTERPFSALRGSRVLAQSGGDLGPVLLVAFVVLTACSHPPRPRPHAAIVPGEILVRTSDPSLLTSEKLSSAARRNDFVVKETQCLAKTCRVVLARLGAATDAAWTYEIIDALAAAKVAGIDGVEPNVVMQPK
jgi:hypothetical protein